MLLCYAVSPGSDVRLGGVDAEDGCIQWLVISFQTSTEFEDVYEPHHHLSTTTRPDGTTTGVSYESSPTPMSAILGHHPPRGRPFQRHVHTVFVDPDFPALSSDFHIFRTLAG